MTPVTTLPGQLETTDHLSHDQREIIEREDDAPYSKEGSESDPMLRADTLFTSSNLAKIPNAAG